MSELFSKTEDCYLLAKYLKEKLGNKIDFVGSIYTSIPNGKYLSSYRRDNREYMFNGNWLPFYFKFSNNEFLRIGVGSKSADSCLGEKMAALSDFYIALREEYGEPDVFYTIKDDEEGFLTLQWSFINKKEEIATFQSGKYFDDAEIETLIIIGEKKNNDGKYSLSDTTREAICRRIGLPFELLYLADQDIENFIKYKTGKEMTFTSGAKVDGYPVASCENKLERLLKKL